jgi:hypothetical protein
MPTTTAMTWTNSNQGIVELIDGETWTVGGLPSGFSRD